MERLFLLVGALIAIAQAGPIEKFESCARTCTDSSKFGYKEGHTYTYQYDSDIKTMVQGTSEDHASLHMSATVQLEVLSKCELSMRLGDVQLKEYDPEGAIMKDVLGDFKQGLERSPVRLSFQDGQIEQLCLTDNEPTWVVNAKRGIISLIQNNMNDFKTNHTTTETDVTGVCNTEYTVQGTGWYTTSVGKSKNLLGCTDRHGYNTAIQAVPYTAKSNIQSLPLLKSDHNCVHEIDTTEGYLKSVTCQEEHVFRPFSKDNSGAVTYNKQTLTFVKQTSGTKRPGAIKNTVSLKFEHMYDANKQPSTRKDLTRKLQEICEMTKSGVKPETPALFTDLVYIMKTADIDDVTGIYAMLKKEKFCSDNLYRTTKYFLDALPIAGTSASLSLMIDLITSKEVTGLEADMWLTSLSFIKTPTIDMLKVVKPLINMPDSNDKAMLSVGTLVHSYCVQNGDCDSNQIVKAIISTFINKMATGCKVKDDTLDTTLMALRGIGNAGFVTSAIPKIELCMKAKQNPTVIRLSAIEAFRRMSCDSSRVALMNILRDTEEDSEIRIAAYKVLMECPSIKVLDIVRQTLAIEEVNQVGSYIWTHLTNLMETSDRHKQDLRSLLEDDVFKKEFDLDKRKFSRNYEGSVFIDQINTGAKVEGDLIWSPKSFIPRSGMVNLTFDLFGHSVNLFEMGGRAEGLEYFFESFFGPGGYFQPPAPESSTNELPENIDDMKIQTIDKRFSTKAADLQASMYMRVFGNELRYVNFHGMDSLLSGPDFNVLDMLLKLSEDNDYTYSHSTMFLDSSFIVPTSSGFPLNLTVNGTATVDLRLKGKMDLRHPPSIDINGRIQPSAAVDISTMMSVDAFVTKSGIKMVSTLHTSTGVQGVLSIDERGTLTSEYEIPEPKMEIIDVRSSFFTIHRDSEREQTINKVNTKSVDYCTPSKLVTITGLELCAEVSYPTASGANTPYFPLSGPTSAGLYLFKRDTHTKYTMAVKSIHNKYSNIVKLVFDTPGSRTNRLVNVDFNLNKKDYTVGMSLQSPWKKADLSGDVKTDNKMQGVTGVIKIDDQYPYSFNALMSKKKTGSVLTWTPTLTIDVSPKRKITVTGILSNDNWKQIDLSYEVEGIPMIPPTATAKIFYKLNQVGIQGNIDIVKGQRYSSAMKLASTRYPKKIMYEPLVSIRTPEKEIVGFGGSFGHHYNRGVEANLVLDVDGCKQSTLKGKLMAKTRGRRSIYNTKAQFTSGPADISITGKIDNKNFRSIGTSFDITYILRRFARNNIKIVSKITNLSASTLTKGKGNVIVEVKRNPEYNFKLMTELEHNKRHTELDTDLWFGPDFKDESRHLDLRVEMNRNISTISQGNFLTRFKFPYLNMSMMAKGAHSHDSKNVDSNLYVKIGRSQPLETSLQLHDFTGSLVNVTGDFQLSSAWSNLGIGLDVNQPLSDVYVSTIKMAANKNQNTITTIVKPNEKDSVVIDSDIRLSNQSPMRLLGAFRVNPSNFKTSMSYESENKRYALELTSATVMGQSSWINADIVHPDRHVTLSLSGKVQNNVRYGSAGIDWNADDRSDDSKTSVSGWMEPLSADHINGSLSLTYPSRKLILNAYHLRTAKYTTHADFQWAPEMKISADTVFGMKGQSFNGIAKLSTPFTQIPNANLDVSYTEDNEEYNTQTTVIWGKTDTMTLTSYVKKPISLNTLVGSIQLKSSLKDLKNVRFVLDHKLSASLASSVDFKWNRQSIKADVVVQNTTKGARLGYQGTVNLQTTYRAIKKGVLDVKVDSNGRTHNAEISLLRNKKIYSLSSTMTHLLNEISHAIGGSLTVKSPTDTYLTKLDHRHTEGNLQSSLTTSWGKDNQILATVKSGYGNSFDTSISIQTPFKIMRTLRLEAKHDMQGTSLNNMLSVYRNEELIGMTEALYNMGDDKGTVTYELSIPSLDVNPRLDAEIAMTEQKAVNARLNAVITPAISLSVEGTIQRMSNGLSTSSDILWKSSIPGYEQMKLTYEIIDGDYLTSTSVFEYSSDKKIQLDTKFALTLTNKHSSITLRTPFESMPYAQAGIDMQGDLDDFVSEAYMEVQPLFDRRSVELTWNTKTGVESMFAFEAPNGQRYALSSMITYDKEIAGKMVLTVPGRRDITATLKHYSTFNELNSQFEILHNRKNSMIATLKVNNNNKWKISASGKLRTEFLSATEEYGTDFTFEGLPTDFTTTAEIYSTSNGTSFVKINTDFENTIESSIIIKSPFIKNIQASFKHDHTPVSFISTAGVIYAGQQIVDLSASLNTEDSYIGNIRIKTPVLEDIKLETRADGHKDNFVLRTEGAYGEDHAELELRSAFGQNLLQQKLILRCLEKEVSLEVNHNGGLDSFKSFTEFNIGLDRHRADISFSNDENIEGTMSLESPYIYPTSASLLVNGHATDFKSRVEFNVDSDRSSLDMYFQMSPTLTSEISFRCPLIIENNVPVVVSLRATDNAINAQYTFGDMKSELDTSLDISSPYRGHINLKSHMFPDFTTSFEHKGSMKKFSCHYEYTIGSDKSELDLSFNGYKGLVGSLELQSYLTPRVSVMFEHSGAMDNFNSRGEFVIGSERREATLSMNLVDKVDMKFDYICPVLGTTTAILTHLGEPTNFKCHAELIRQNDKWEGDMKMETTQNDINYEVSAQSPNSQKDINFNFKLSGAPSDFALHSELTFGLENAIADLKHQLTSESLKSAVTFTSTVCDDISAGLETAFQPSRQYFSKVSFTKGSSESFGSISLKKDDNKYDSSLDISSPFTPSISITGQHNGAFNNFVTKYSASIGENNFNGQLNLNVIQSIQAGFKLNRPNVAFDASLLDTEISMSAMKDDETYTVSLKYPSLNCDNIKLEGKLTTPIEGLRHVTAMYQHEGTLRNLHCTGKIEIEGVDSTTELKLDTSNVNKIDGSLTIDTPYMKKTVFQIAHAMDADKYTFTAGVTADNKDVIGYTIKYNNGTEKQGKVELNFDGTVYNVIDFALDESHFEVSTGMTQIKSALNVDPKKQLSLTIESPYLPTFVMDINYSGSLDNEFKTQTKMVVDGQKLLHFVLTKSYKSGGTIATFILEIPQDNYMGEFSNIQKIQGMQMSAKLSNSGSSLIESSLEYDSYDKLLVDFSLESSIPHKLSTKFYLLNTDSSINSIVDVTHESNNLLNGRFDYKASPKNIRGNGKVDINGITSNVNVNADESTQGFDMDLITDSGRYAIVSKYEGQRYLDTSIHIIRPNQDDIVATLSHSPRKYKSVSTLKLQYNAAHYVDMECTQMLKDGYAVITSVKTPYEGFELSSIELSMEGVMPHIKSAGELQIAGEKYSVSIDTSDMKKNYINVKTPFELFRDMSLTTYLDGGYNNFKTGGKLEYATGKAIELDIAHKLVSLDIESSIRFTSPYTEPIVVSTTHTSTSTSLSNQFVLSNGDSSLKSDTKWNAGQSFLSFSSSQLVTMSGETFEQNLDIKHDGTLDNFHTEINFNSLGYKHRLDASFKLEPIVEGSLELMTPYKNIEDIKLSFSHTGMSSGMVSTGEVVYAPNKAIKGKVDVQYYDWKRVVSVVELITPFEDMKTNNIKYDHSIRAGVVEGKLDAIVFSKAFKSSVEAKMVPLSLDIDIVTPVEGFEVMAFHGKYAKSSDKIDGSIETQWNSNQKLSATVSCTLQGPYELRMAVDSPFKQAKRILLDAEHNTIPNGWKQSVKLVHNYNVIVNADAENSLSNSNLHSLLKVRSPMPMMFEVTGAYDVDRTQIDIIADGNTNDKTIDLKIQGAYDLTTKKTFNVKVTQAYLPSGEVTLKGELNDQSNSGSLSFGEETYGYTLQYSQYDATVKLIVPSRSVQLAGSHRGRVTEGTFMWDADRDQTKRVGLRCNIYPTTNLMKADISVTLPSIGKDLQLDSEMTFNKGQVLFEGTTELTYSRDTSRKIMFTSKVEDISTWGNKNYSLSFGVSHPFSTVDIKMNSHIGKSNDKYSAGIALEYMTVRRQTKKFKIGGTIDQLRKTISFEVLSPVKTISISGSAQTGDKFHLSLLNVYDQKRPLYTSLTVDQTSRSVNFKMNYDLNNPSDEFQVSAKYVNSSAVAAEIFHTIRGIKTTDALTTARLNTSHLLHSRIHWRPEMLQDLKLYLNKKQADYERRVQEVEGSIIASMVREIDGKLKKIQYAIEEELGRENMLVLDSVFQSVSNMNNNFRRGPVVVSPEVYPSPSAGLTMSNSGVSYIPYLRQQVSSSFEGIKMISEQMPGYAANVMSDTTAMHFLSQYGLNYVVEVSIRDYMSNMENKLTTELTDLERIIMSYLQSPFTVYDPEHGEIQLELHSILPIQSLDTVPEIDLMKYVDNMVNTVQQYVPKQVPSVNLNLDSEWLPPFTGVATVTDGHKVTTFDGYVFDLDVDCTYILSRDYTDGNFSLILSNEGDTVLTIITGSRTIIMNENGQVLVGGVEVTSDFYDGTGLSVTKSQGGSVINIKEGNHFSIDYTPDLDHLELSVSGWYHGKTGGLFGTYDNEPSNDLMTSFGKVIDNSSRVAKTWTVGKNSC